MFPDRLSEIAKSPAVTCIPLADDIETPTKKRALCDQVVALPGQESA